MGARPKTAQIIPGPLLNAVLFRCIMGQMHAMFSVAYCHVALFCASANAAHLNIFLKATLIHWSVVSAYSESLCEYCFELKK